jgi:hypothetical protein
MDFETFLMAFPDRRLSFLKPIVGYNLDLDSDSTYILVSYSFDENFGLVLLGNF